MAEKYSFFDAELNGSGAYDRTYSSADLASYFASFIGNGIYANPATNLQVSAVSGNMKVSIAAGKAWINGYYYELTEAIPLTLAVGDSSNPRYDLIVCSLNLSKRMIELKVIQGAAAISPTIPAYSRTSTVYDLVLAEVYVAAGTTAVTQSIITDTRFDGNLCGVVSGVIEQINTTNLFRQYDSEFASWFAGVKGTLSGDAAGNLANQITALQTRVTPVQYGGTGQATIAAARNAFGLGNTTGALPVANGGTGASTASSALNNLGITWGTTAAPSTGTPNTIYIQLL